MQIYTSLPLDFSHIGQRTINQDALYPAAGKATAETQMFAVCDGMGGADKGEVASQLLCQAIERYATSMNYPVFDAVHLRAALDLAYDAYTDYLRQHPLVSRMGSTLAFLQFHDKGVTVAHIGDSRVYQWRAGRLIFKTKDHRQVNDMVESGIITAEQALTHPWRNRLSRAVLVNAADRMEKVGRPMPDVSRLTDVQSGDYFFMCTDGVLENLDEALLEKLLVADVPDRAKLQAIEALCDGRTKDNYSGYLIGIQQVVQGEPVSTVEFV